VPSVSEEGDDTANQLYLAVDSAVVWTYRVTNTGTIPLQVTALVDNRGTAATADDFTPTARPHRHPQRRRRQRERPARRR